MARRRRRKPPPELHLLHRHVLTLAAEARLKAETAARVKEARLELGLTQELLGRAFGRSQPWTREVESARQWAPHWLLVGLARATERSVAWFYGEEPPSG